MLRLFGPGGFEVNCCELAASFCQFKPCIVKAGLSNPTDSLLRSLIGLPGAQRNLDFGDNLSGVLSKLPCELQKARNATPHRREARGLPRAR